MVSHKNLYRIKKKRKINNSDEKIQKIREIVRRPQFDPRPRTTTTSTTSFTEKIEYSTLTTSAGTGSTKYFVPTPMPLQYESHNKDDLQVEETTFKSFRNFLPTDHSVLEEDNFYDESISRKNADDDQETEEARVNKSSVYSSVKKLIKSMTVKTRENDTFVPTPVPLLLRKDSSSNSNPGSSSTLNEFEKNSEENEKVKIIEPAPLVSVASYSPLTEKPLEVPFEISKIEKPISGSGRPEPRTLFSNKKNIGDYNIGHNKVS